MLRESQRQRARLIEARAWLLRCRGWSQARIAEDLGLAQPTVSKALARIERRELKRMSASIELKKVTQSGQLDHVIEESLDAWHRSKLPRKRAARKVAGGAGEGGEGGPDEVQTTEIIERDGDPAHLYVAMNAMDRQRSLWGLDVAPAMQDPASSVAELVRDMQARGDGYDRRKAEENQAGDPPGTVRPDPPGTGPLPDGPQPVQ